MNSFKLFKFGQFNKFDTIKSKSEIKIFLIICSEFKCLSFNFDSLLALWWSQF